MVMGQKFAGLNTEFGQLAIGKFCQPNRNLVTVSNQGKIRQQKERAELRLS